MAYACINCKTETDPALRACVHCGEKITDFLRNWVDRPIDGKYQIISRLGIGGMGEVFKVLHIHLNTVRVIKLMRPQLSEQAEASARFLREARLATRINHPNVATLFDFDTLDDSTYYMVWEFIDGRTITSLLRKRGAVSASSAARLSIEALSGLDAIHRAGIIHRDISPENLMITTDDEGNQRVKIIDLGIAKGEDTTDHQTQTGMFIGKWKYCSPEHLGFLPQDETIDGRADLYSFGTVLFEMLTGEVPFDASSPHDFIMKHSKEIPRRPSELNPTLAKFPELDAIVLKALEKNRNNRFQSAREFAANLRALLPKLEGEDDTDPGSGHLVSGTFGMAHQGLTHPDTTVAMGGGDDRTLVTGGGGTTVSERGLSAGVPTEAKGFDEATLHRTAEKTASDGAPRRVGLLVVAAIVLAIVAATLFVVLTKRDGGASDGSSRQAAVVMGRVGLNAFPWGELSRITSLDTGDSISIESGLVTPGSIELPAGRYEVVIANSDLGIELSQIVTVAGGQYSSVMVRFAEGENGRPSFLEAIP